MSAPARYDHFSLTATGPATEDTLFTGGVPGVYQLRISLVNMVTGDVIVLRRYADDIHTGTIQLVETFTIKGAPTTSHLKEIGPFGACTQTAGEGKVTLEQTGGAVKTFAIGILRY